MTEPTPTASWRPGRRGAFLAMFGAAYLLIGQALINANDTPLVDHVFRFALAIMPLHGWGIVWMVCGAVAVLDGVWPRGRDSIGFAAAVLAPVAWAFVYFVAWLQLDARGVSNLWQSALLYGLIAGAVLIVAGMPEPAAVAGVIERTAR